MQRYYAAIDLKSFYASVECVERGLDPLDTNLVVADKSRTEKTICLAVSPSLKAYGIPGRARLFEVIQKVGKVNEARRRSAEGGEFTGKSFSDNALRANASLELDYIVAPPQMARYMEISAKIYGIYLKYVAPEDIFAYSIDEVFIDITGYLAAYQVTPHEMVRMLINDVLKTTGITATAGIGTNLYLCKVAMDIVAKHIPADSDGVRIAELDDRSFREKLWDHKPITDFWRCGEATALRLEKFGIYTMGELARFSLSKYQVDKLYKEFGKNTELIIDHAWGYEPTLISDVKAYTPENNSISSGQVLQQPTDYERTRLIVWEMADMLSLDLVNKGFVTDQIVLTVGYDQESLRKRRYKGKIVTDRYGRNIPKHAHGTVRLGQFTSSTRIIIKKVMELYDTIIDTSLLSRRITLAACNVIREEEITRDENFEQIDIFSITPTLEARTLEKERAIQEAMLQVKRKFGKNAVLKGRNFTEGATARARNRTIGGHKA